MKRDFTYLSTKHIPTQQNPYSRTSEPSLKRQRYNINNNSNLQTYANNETRNNK